MAQRGRGVGRVARVWVQMGESFHRSRSHSIPSLLSAWNAVPPTLPDIHRCHFSPRSGLCLNVTSPDCSGDGSPTHSPVLTPFPCLYRLARSASFLGQPQPMTTNQQKFSHSLEARCLKSRCWQDHAPSEGSGGGWAPSLTSCGSRWSLACGRIPPISASIFMRSLLCVVSLLFCLL